MFTVRVLHAKTAFFSVSSCYLGTEDEKKRILENLATNYAHVADITVSGGGHTTTSVLSHAFHGTQNTDHAYVLNSNVTSFGAVHRSTSVGDVMQLDGRTYIVAPIGFDDVTELLP